MTTAAPHRHARERASPASRPRCSLRHEHSRCSKTAPARTTTGSGSSGPSRTPTPACAAPGPCMRRALSLAPGAPSAVYERVAIPASVRATLAGHATRSQAVRPEAFCSVAERTPGPCTSLAPVHPAQQPNIGPSRSLGTRDFCSATSTSCTTARPERGLRRRVACPSGARRATEPHRLQVAVADRAAQELRHQQPYPADRGADSGRAPLPRLWLRRKTQASAQRAAR